MCAICWNRYATSTANSCAVSKRSERWHRRRPCGSILGRWLKSSPPCSKPSAGLARASQFLPCRPLPMNAETVQEAHRQKLACIYLRQSTLKQVRQHQESTERQYALRDKALQLGWPADQILILDHDLGLSGTQMANRPDFQRLVADVSLQKVGA